jgi:acyl phosphate:glycerol-3-phosphate acyltransferase
VTVILAVVTSYLIGSVPFALILARRWGAADIRSVGSGNLGASNVMRTSGLRAGLTVLLLDIAKGAGSVALAQRLNDGAAVPAAAGFAAIAGHVFPLWARFRGGKGVATACGAFSILAPLAIPPILAIFAIIVWATKYISVGSIVASMALPPIAYATGSPPPVVLAAISAAALIVVRHRTNLARLRAGTERRLGVRIGAREA